MNILTYILYLTEAHKDHEIDIHTFMYESDLEVCPICNEWLIQRTKPKLTP